MQRKTRALALSTVLFLTMGTSSARPELSLNLNDVIQVLGSVRNAAHPVDNALIIALNLSTYYATQTQSQRDGTFRLPPLRAGVYRIIAVKQGFAPAIATLLPNARTHTVVFKMQTEKAADSRARDEIWALRGSLPKDILREVDQILGEASPQTANASSQRFAAELVSVAGLYAEQSAPKSAQTALGVKGDLGKGWQLDFQGRLNRVDETSLYSSNETPLAKSSGLSMELTANDDEAYRIASTSSTWRRGDRQQISELGPADLQAHNFEWERHGSKVQVRYLAQENMFRALQNSEILEVSGDKTLLESNRSRLGVSLKLEQQNYLVSTSSPSVPFRTADLAANGEWSPLSRVVLHYGLRTRVAEQGAEWAPQTAAEWRFDDDSSFLITAVYKIYEDQQPVRTLPSLVFWSQPGTAAPRYAYTVAFVSGDPKRSRFSASASLSEIDAPLRVVFDNGLEQLGEGLYLDAGDVRRDLTVAFRRNVGKRFAVDVSTSVGSAEGLNGTGQATEKVYVVGDLQSLYRPSGTSIDVSYRQIEQPPLNEEITLATERMNVTMGQSLHLPFDMRLLLGIELARPSGFILSTEELSQEFERRYVGGLSFAF